MTTKRCHEPELSFVVGPPLRPRGDNPLDPITLDRRALQEIIEHFRKAFKKSNGVSAPQISSPRYFERVHRMMAHLRQEMFPEHNARWRELPPFSREAEWGPLYRERIQIGTGFVDWLLAHHFSRLSIGDLASEYWTSEYCKALARAREAEAPVTDSWDKPLRPETDCTDSWPD
jgi:hypothetical protein